MNFSLEGFELFRVFVRKPRELTNGERELLMSSIARSLASHHYKVQALTILEGITSPRTSHLESDSTFEPTGYPHASARSFIKWG